uniref:Uncharacterized protein n=1 Tax=Macrostomum lignano TaxID=282301 RepID=A0A1I8FAR7_9PLAT
MDSPNFQSGAFPKHITACFSDSPLATKSNWPAARHHPSSVLPHWSNAACRGLLVVSRCANSPSRQRQTTSQYYLVTWTPGSGIGGDHRFG